MRHNGASSQLWCNYPREPSVTDVQYVLVVFQGSINRMTTSERFLLIETPLLVSLPPCSIRLCFCRCKDNKPSSLGSVINGDTLLLLYELLVDYVRHDLFSSMLGYIAVERFLFPQHNVTVADGSSSVLFYIILMKTVREILRCHICYMKSKNCLNFAMFCIV